MSILNVLKAVSEAPRLTDEEKREARKVEYYRELNRALRRGDKPKVIRAKRPHVAAG